MLVFEHLDLLYPDERRQAEVEARRESCEEAFEEGVAHGRALALEQVEKERRLLMQEQPREKTLNDKILAAVLPDPAIPTKHYQAPYRRYRCSLFSWALHVRLQERISTL